MANTLKTAVNNAASGFNWVTVYTCPVAKSAIVRSVIAANSASAQIRAELGIEREGVVTSLAPSISITNSSSANLLASTVTLQSSDKLVAREATAPRMGPLLGPSGAGYNTLALADGSALIQAGINGIFRSTDGGKSWTQVSSFTATSRIGAKIGSSLFFYTGFASAVRSTDGGLTWESVAVTNPPDTATINLLGNILFNGVVYGGLSSGRLTTTTDGITWTLATGFPASPVNSLAWTGTHWVAGRNSTSPDIFYSTNGAAWTTVAAIAGATTQINRLISNGSGIVLATSNNASGISRSTDHGVTWAAVSQTGISTTLTMTWTGTHFYLPNTSNPTKYYITSAGQAGTYFGPYGGFPTGATPYSTGFFGGDLSITRFIPTTGIPTLFYGMDITASILEVS